MPDIYHYLYDCQLNAFFHAVLYDRFTVRNLLQGYFVPCLYNSLKR